VLPLEKLASEIQHRVAIGRSSPTGPRAEIKP